LDNLLFNEIAQTPTPDLIELLDPFCKDLEKTAERYMNYDLLAICLTFLLMLSRAHMLVERFRSPQDGFFQSTSKDRPSQP
jgi:hypothetical protein